MSTCDDESKTRPGATPAARDDAPTTGTAAVPIPADNASTTGKHVPAADPAASRASRRPGRPVLVLAVLLALAVVAAVTFGALWWRASSRAHAGAEALATARAYAVTVTTYDYQQLDRNFVDVLDGATGEFRNQYSGASQTLRQLITDAKARATGTVLDAGVRSATRDEVVVLVFVDQSITNAASPQPKIDHTRVVMTLTRHDGRWLVDKLELT